LRERGEENSRNGANKSPTMHLYHSTSYACAAAILENGFEDATGPYGSVTSTLTGVFFSSEPVDENDGATSSEAILVVEAPDTAHIEQFEIIRDMRGFREWCLPAATVNAWPRLRLDQDELDEVDSVRFGPFLGHSGPQDAF
jgi:hypothetical protein